MFKSVSEFAKLFSMLFLVCGIYFLCQSSFIVAAVAIVSFAVLTFLDSDWSFDNLNFANHNLVIGLATCVLIFLNVYFIYQEMKYDPLLNQVDSFERDAYLQFENMLFADIKPCTDLHNVLMSNKTPNEADLRAIKKVCYNVVNVIDKETVPDAMPSDIKKLCEDNKTEFKRIAINITSYDYKKGAVQQSLISRIKSNVSFLIKNMTRIRSSLKIKDELSEEKKTFLKI